RATGAHPDGGQFGAPEPETARVHGAPDHGGDRTRRRGMGAVRRAVLGLGRGGHDGPPGLRRGNRPGVRGPCRRPAAVRRGGIMTEVSLELIGLSRRFASVVALDGLTFSVLPCPTR